MNEGGSMNRPFFFGERCTASVALTGLRVAELYQNVTHSLVVPVPRPVWAGLMGQIDGHDRCSITADHECRRRLAGRLSKPDRGDPQKSVSRLPSARAS